MTAESIAGPVFEALDIWKAFPGIQALKGASFRGFAGRIHGIVGENGAGKSTLMRIVAGVYQPDRGRIVIDGADVRHSDPISARRSGISMVYQDTRLAPDLDAAHNIWLGHEPVSAFGLIDQRRLYRNTERLLETFDLKVDPRAVIRSLSAAQRYAVEIAKALSIEPKVLILDEPTAALNVREVDSLFAVLRQLRALGTSVVFVSHRLPEVLELTDTITVMKDGEVVGTLPTTEASEAVLVSMMVGRPVEIVFPDRAAEVGDTVLEVRGLSSPGAFENVSFVVRRGEIVGLGGIEGNGQRELARALFGLGEITSGSVRLLGQEISVKSPRQAIKAGIAYISNDRRAESLMLPLSVLENVALPTLSTRARSGFVQTDREQQAVSRVVAEYDIRAPGLAATLEGLSGGNQQKVALGRWTLASLKVIVLDEPTQGVDVRSKLDLYERIRRLADSGVAVVLLSSDLIELIGLSDRILVMSNGCIVREVPAAEATEAVIVGAAVTAVRTDRADSARRESAIMRGRRRLPENWRAPFVLLAALALAGFFSALESPYFLTPDNLGNLAMVATPLAIVAIGQTLVLLLGGIDLSIGSLMSLVVGVASYLVVSDSPIGVPLGVVACLLLGVAVGAANGLLIRYTRLPDLVVTLAMLFMANGLALIVRPFPGGSVDSTYMGFVTFMAGPVPVIAVLTLIMLFVIQFGLERTRAGVQLYATGSSREAAFIAGIAVDRVRVLAYMLSGLTAAIGGLVLAARLGSGDPSAGTTFTLASVTAAVVGGVSLFGGRGTLVGALLGAILVVGIQNVLGLIQISSYYQYVWTGVLTFVGVAVYSLNWSALAGHLRARVAPGKGGAS